MPQLLMIRHRYGDRYLHNGALQIGFSDLFSNVCSNNLKSKNRINHRLESSAKVSLQTTPYLWNKWPLNLSLNDI
ncbi:hypothetical protein T10_9560 [Trichinella papuae]|uniref:Uncharacterized protein n=1 Tax=Trichinella papuae TaxID=268474 RepID=A0A0V1M749_9BILA|nr:hypothetical protein T10_9560 [Trichinella papuae]